jgi:S1-C subfamily serine protease
MMKGTRHGKFHRQSLVTMALLSVVMLAATPVFAFAFSGPAFGRSRGLIISRSTTVSTPSPISKTMTTRLFSVPASADLALNVARMVQPAVALVTPIGVRNMTARGSGFAINFNTSSTEYTYFVTAAHVAAPGFDIEIKLGEISRPATVVGRNITLDLALIRTDKIQNIPSLDIASDIPEVGSIAFAHGYPASRMRRGPAMTSGIVCGIADGLGMPDGSMASNYLSNQTDETIYVVTDAAMSGGMSGGPLVNAVGTVMGVNALVRPDLRALGNYAVSAEEIRSFLANVEQRSSEDNVSATGYRVYLFNDRMNKKERVSSVLKSVANMEEEDANKVMMEAHSTGRGVVREFAGRVQAEELCKALRMEDILVEVDQIFA